MMSKARNELVTRTGPGTPCGELFRRYWQPAALSEEMPKGGAPKPVRLLGEDLVLFRTRRGEPGLMGLHCPHRGTDLSYGRIEEDGLRCLYHGWLLGRDGRCLEQPGEPPNSRFKDRIRHTAYPCREAGGLILAYMGPGEAPPLPDFPIFAAPAGHVWASKMIQECNYLQGNEGNVDPQHLSVLHRMASPDLAPDERSKEVDMLIGADPAPEIAFEETPFGLRVYASRALGDGRKYVRVTNFIMPNCSAFDGGPLHDPRRVRPKPNVGYWMHWHVPIDDEHHWKYIVAYCYDDPIDPAYQLGMIHGERDGAYDSIRTKKNRYLQDRAEMERLTWLGMGHNFQIHDRFAIESQSPIVDRTKEHLGASDRAVTAMRKLLLAAIEDLREGRDPRMAAGDGAARALRDLVVVSETVPAAMDAKRVWREMRPGPRAAARSVAE